VYQKTGRLKLAEYHFRRALSINPSNVVLYCCVGTVMERRGDLEGALGVFERSLEIDEENKMARFRKARVLMGLQRYEVSLFDCAWRGLCFPLPFADVHFLAN
jgi:anaphase-promoting complex subunit 3